MAAREQLDANGYYLCKGLFAPNAENISDAVKQLFGLYRPFTDFNQMLFELFEADLEGFLGCANAAQRLIEVVSFSTNDLLKKLLVNLGLKMPIVNTRPLMSYSSRRLAKNENYWRVPAHQDWPSMQGSINGITLWMPLVDVTDDLGPLEVIPGSHLNGPMPHADNGVPLLIESEKNFTPISMKAGDVLCFSPFLVHRSGTNSTDDKVRWSLHMRYDDASEETFIKRKFPLHRIDKRKEGILHPNFPAIDQLKNYHGA